MTEFGSSFISKRNSKKSRRSSRDGATVGIEIGYSTIYMVRLEKDVDGKILLKECKASEFDPNLYLEPIFVSIIKNALKQFCGSSKDVSIWTAPKLNRLRLHHIKIPQVSSTRLPSAVYWGLQREEPFLENETVVDFQIEEGAANNNILNITGALVERKGIEDIQRAFTQSGFTLAGIGLPLFALCNLVNLRGDVRQDSPVLICQLGQHATSVSVGLNGRLVFTRDIPLGLENLAETLVKETEPIISQEQACNLILKLGFGDEKFSSEEVLQRENALNLLRPILERAARQIERTIQYYQSNFDTLPIETVFIGGEIAARGALFNFLSEQLSLAVIAIDPFDTPDLQANISLPSERADRIAYGPAFGLALEGSQEGINLAHTYSERKSEGKHRKIAVGASALLMLMTAATVFFYNWQQSQLRFFSAERTTLEQSLSALGPPLTEAVILEATEEVRVLQEQRRAAAKRYEGLAQLSEITRLTPKNISLLHISTTMGSPIESSTDSEETLILKGVVNGDRTTLETSLTIYVARFDQSPLFHTVQVNSTKLVESSNELYLFFTLSVKSMEKIDKDITEDSTSGN